MDLRSNKGEVPLEVRRLVTGHGAGGQSLVSIDSAPPVTAAYEHIPGMITRLVWATSADGAIEADPQDITTPSLSHVPSVGETRFLIVTFPPDRVFAAADFDPHLAAQENKRLTPGLAELFEPDGFHRSDTIDYGILLDGELWIELDDGVKERLRPHDVVIQNGTRHAWRNESDKLATMAFVLIGRSRGP